VKTGNILLTTEKLSKDFKFLFLKRLEGGEKIFVFYFTFYFFKKVDKIFNSVVDADYPAESFLFTI